MASIFLSYRRDDSSGYTGRLHDRFVQRWGRERVFMDLDNIDPGEDFLEVIDRTLAQCAVVVVVVGPRWLTAADASGRRRIDNAADAHRMEVEAGLRRGIRVIPVLVGGADMPAEADLPEPLRAFARRNASEVSDRRFDFDVGRLVDAIDRALTATAASREGPAVTAPPAPSVTDRPGEPRATGGRDAVDRPSSVQTGTSSRFPPLGKLVPAIAVVGLVVLGLVLWRAAPPVRDTSPPGEPTPPHDAPPPTPLYTGPRLSLRGQHASPSGLVPFDALEVLGRTVRTSTSDLIRLEALPIGAVVPAFGIIDAVAQGTLDFGLVPPTVLYGKDAAFALVESTPFGPDVSGYVRWRRDPEVVSSVDALYRSVGVKGILCGVNAPIADVWSRRRIQRPSDLTGWKVRATGLVMEIFRAAGATPILLSLGELSPALQRGVIDGVGVLSPEAGVQVGVHKAVDVVYVPGVVIPVIGLDLVVGVQRWASLPREARAALESGCARTVQEMVDRSSAAQRQAMATLSASSVTTTTLPEPVVDALRSAWGRVAADRRSNPAFARLLASSARR
jgi:TRAP-type mannitol/chloroaromatic compound transport system substrate-binding protein